jgi:hypothetical protein
MSLLALVLMTLPASAAGDSVGNRLRTQPPRPVPAATQPQAPVRLPAPNTNPTTPGGSGAKAARSAALATQTAMTTCTPVAPTIDQRVLVLTADGKEYSMYDPVAPDKPGAIQTALDYLGIPYEVYTATTRTLVDSPQQSDPVPATARVTAAGLNESMLFTQTTDPVTGCVTSREAYYSGIITATSGLAASGASVSALSDAEWQTLWGYASQFHVRQLVWYAFPNDIYGFQAPSSGGSSATATLTAAGAQVFNYLNPSATIPIANTWAYFAKASADAVPLLTDASGNALIAMRATVDGRETLAATFDSNQYLLHDQILNYGMVNWVTKGLFLGERHIFATPQEDDLLIADNVWNVSPTAITSILANGATWEITTKTTPGIAYADGQTIAVQMANPSAYNGTFTIASVSSQGAPFADALAKIVINNTTIPTAYVSESGLLQQQLAPDTLPLSTPAAPLVDCKILGSADPTTSLPLYRVTGSDISSLSAWQTTTRAPGGRFTGFFLSHAFNGWGTSSDFYSSSDASRLVPVPTPSNDSLISAIKVDQAKYGFINHTWGHGNLDGVPNTTWPTALDNDTPRMPIEQNLAANDQLANGIRPGSYVSTVVGPFTTYDKRNLVQPDVSGLSAPNAMNGAYSWGIRYVVSDTSVAKPSGANPSPNAGISNPINSGILEIPRRPVNLYYLASTPGEWLAADNCLYPPTAAFGTQFPSGSYPVYGAVTQSKDLVDRVSNDLLPYMLRGDMDPWMFHQPNLRAYDGTHSIYGDLMDALFAKYTALFNLPVQSLAMDKLGERFDSRMTYNASHASARLTGSELALSSPKKASVPTTLPTGVAVTGSETYGEQQLLETSLAAGQTVKLNVAAITALPLDQSRAYGQPNPTLTGQVTGILPADASSITVSYTTTATSTSVPGKYPIYASVSGPGLGTYKYVVTTTVGTLTVTPAPLVVTVSQDTGSVNGQVGTRLYGDPTSPNFTGTLAGVLPGDTISVSGVSVPALQPNTPAGQYAFKVDLNDPAGQLAYYTYVTSPAAFTVVPAPLLVTVNNTSKKYGDVNPPQGVSYAGFVLGQDVAALGGTLTYATTATSASPVGSYPVNGSGLTSANYAIAYVPGTLTIGPAPLTITAADATRVAGEQNPPFTGTLTGLVNGDSILVSYSTSADTGSPEGSYAIEPLPVDNSPSSLGNYSVTLVNGTLTVTTATPTPTSTSTPSPTPTDTPTPAPTSTPSPIPTDTPTPAPTSTPSPTPTDTPTQPPAPTPTDVPSSSPTDTPTQPPAPTPTATPAPSNSGGGGGGGHSGGSGAPVNIGGGGGGGGASAGGVAPAPLPAVPPPVEPTLAPVPTSSSSQAAVPTPTPAPTQPAIQPISASVDPLTGGALDTPEGRLHLVVPPNATTDIVLVSVAPGELVSDTNADLPSAVTPPPLFQPGTTRFTITALDTTTYPVVGVSQHLSMVLDPDLADVAGANADRSRLTLGYFDELAQAWIPLATRVTDTGMLQADSDNFGQFGVLLRTGTLTLCAAPDSMLWSGPSTTAEPFGLAEPGASYVILDQVGQRYLIQDSSGSIAWLDVGALSTCAPEAPLDATTGDVGGSQS